MNRRDLITYAILNRSKYLAGCFTLRSTKASIYIFIYIRALHICTPIIGKVARATVLFYVFGDGIVQVY